ncbi:MAG: hypothetical protein ABI867_12365 [Kofleriaceae bacterium]
MRAVVLAGLALGCVNTIHVSRPQPVATKATAFSLQSQDGSTITLADVLAHDHAVLVFYRGHW